MYCFSSFGKEKRGKRIKMVFCKRSRRDGSCQVGYFVDIRTEEFIWRQVNVLNYVEREGEAKDLVSVEIVVERESQKGVMVGKVRK